MLSKIKECWYSIKHGIKNIVNWLPVIWYDTQIDFDYSFFRLLYKKLQLIEQKFAEDEVYVGQEKDLKRIKTCRILCERLITDFYGDNALKPLLTKYPHYFDNITFNKSEIRFE